jgi:hypothetical protein
MTDAIDLIHRASDDAEAIATHLLGHPNKRLSSSREMRWGEHGKICMSLAGPRRGRWRDFSQDVGGDALDLVEQVTGLHRKGAIGWVRQWLGEGGAPANLQPPAPANLPDRYSANLQNRDDDRDARFRRNLAADIWQTAARLTGSPAETYLVRHRLGGRPVPEAVYRGGALRWNATERSFPGAVGAMIALMTDPLTGESRGVHRTYLDEGGEKVGRKMLGNWGCVRLWPDAEVTLGLVIGEGIETTIAGAMLTGRCPAWAALDAGGVKKFPVLDGVEGITILVDHDTNEAGQKAAEGCAANWSSHGREAVLLTPNGVGDFNDMLLEEAA